MRERVYRRLQVFGQASVRADAFWSCLALLVLLGALYGTVLALSLSGHGDSQDAIDSPEARRLQLLVWRIALVCWLFSLPSLWFVASRWITRRTQEPITDLMRQCGEIRAGRRSARLGYSGNDEALAGLRDAMNELLGHFNKIVSYQCQFAADAAHELRTPLTALSVVGENALARRCTSAELREVVGSMLEESKHMKRLIDALLQLSRASCLSASADPQLAREPTPIELGMLARGCVEPLQVLAEEKRQRIELNATPVWADADSTLVRQALLNVIHNAIVHCPEGAHIQVVTAPLASDVAMIRVMDDGPGIPLEQQADVFKRFYRTVRASRRGSLGLGLSIAKAVLKSQRGNIHLCSEPGAGCCFTLTLPRVPADACVSSDFHAHAHARDSRREYVVDAEQGISQPV